MFGNNFCRKGGSWISILSIVKISINFCILNSTYQWSICNVEMQIKNEDICYIKKQYIYAQYKTIENTVDLQTNNMKMKLTVILLDLFIPFPCAYHWHQSTSNMRTWAKKLCFKKIKVPFAFWRSVKNLRNVFVNDVKLHSCSKKRKIHGRAKKHPCWKFLLDV